MTDRVKGFYVTLEQDVRVDDVESLVNAVRQLKGVAAVNVNISNADDWMNRMQLRSQIRRKLYSAIDRVFDEKEGK